MAVDDLDLFREALPNVFEDLPMPTGWDDWIVVSVGDPETWRLDEFETGDAWLPPDAERAKPVGRTEWEPSAPEFGPPSDEIGPWAGAPRRRAGGEPPPPDALAFYLPFHFFHPTWWGIYLTAEGVIEVARDLVRRSGGSLPWQEALGASRLFLYGHEAFHHLVESYATRLEVTHRQPLYRIGFRAEYNRTAHDSDEEALASAFGYAKVKKAFRDPAKRRIVLKALAARIHDDPPGYCRAVDYLTKTRFERRKHQFAELNHSASLSVPKIGPDVWLSFPHALSGISRITSRVNYIVHRSSPLGRRLQLGGIFLRQREVVRRLQDLVGLRPVRHGRHPVFETRDGRRVPIPDHPGDIAPGTLRSIIREAGLTMSLEEFKGL